jgi:hypothetical protein
MTRTAPANPILSPAVAGLGNRAGDGVRAGCPKAGGAWAPHRRPRSGPRPAKVGRVLVDARRRMPHRLLSDRARRGWRATRRAERDGGTGGAAPGHPPAARAAAD